MNVRQLEAFRAVMLTGTVTAAAEMLHVSQPAVSKLIAGLEATCGYDLFVRKAGRALPTPEAQQLYCKVEQMFVGVHAIRRESDRIRDQASGQVAIAAFPALAGRALPRLLTGFLASRPDLRLSLRSMASRRVLETVGAQQADIGFSIMPCEHPGVDVEHLHRLERVCVVPRGHRLAGARSVSPEDLRGEPFVSLNVEDPDHLAIEKVFCDLGIQRRLRIETLHSETACSFVANGAGVTIIDPLTPAEHGDAVIALPFVPPVYLNVWLLWPSHRIRSKLALSIADLVRDWLAATYPPGSAAPVALPADNLRG
ncbi:LysR substrate-binding domain-containing protein [Marinimicrococcus flavescens]|uniref:LysR substrate-binding domain-containing protein n=1 Tax=Marinimicrococcus flavescens TaxID=3031815 RepID=A0AAP3XS92_9PROT|nr:LysR substrate-binding domain-containing protein [Marinimicrococcus flavescens]